MADSEVFKTPSRPLKRPCLGKDKRPAETEYSPITIPPSPMMKKLGCGTGVIVYKLDRGSFSPSLGTTRRSPWAIKKAKRMRQEALERLKRESEILKMLDHPNIISYRQFTLMENGDACLSMEQGGISLDALIERYGEEDMAFTAKEVASVSLFVARALSYLHDTHKLLHGDVKSGNVLITDDFKHVKLCDFGVALKMKEDLSGPLDPSEFYTGTQPWCSKEVLEDGPITDKADIFAYGLLIWEMLALDIPHVKLLTDGDDEENSDDPDRSCVSDNHNDDAYTEALGTRPALPNRNFDSDYLPMIGLFACCTEADYKKRPCATQCAKAIEPLAKELNVISHSIVNGELKDNSYKKTL